MVLSYFDVPSRLSGKPSPTFTVRHEALNTPVCIINRNSRNVNNTVHNHRKSTKILLTMPHSNALTLCFFKPLKIIRFSYTQTEACINNTVFLDMTQRTLLQNALLRNVDELVPDKTVSRSRVQYCHCQGRNNFRSHIAFCKSLALSLYSKWHHPVDFPTLVKQESALACSYHGDLKYRRYVWCVAFTSTLPPDHHHHHHHR